MWWTNGGWIAASRKRHYRLTNNLCQGCGKSYDDCHCRSRRRWMGEENAEERRKSKIVSAAYQFRDMVLRLTNPPSNSRPYKRSDYKMLKESALGKK